MYTVYSAVYSTHILGYSPGTGHVLWKVKPLLQFGFQTDSHLLKKPQNN